MCRLFGLIANKEVDIIFSMLKAERKFKEQGKKNPDGWGVGWYENNEPKIEKDDKSAFDSPTFDKLIKEIRSSIFIAHVRYASSGSIRKENSHPFGFKNWIFAHNGTVQKNRILKLLTAPYNENFTSEPIDSEIYFRFIIQNIEEEKDVIKGIKKSVREVINDAKGANFILSDGENIYAFKHGKDLYFLVRDPLRPFSTTSKETMALIESKRMSNEKAVLIATEKLTCDENWEKLRDGEIIFINSKLNILREEI